MDNPNSQTVREMNYSGDAATYGFTSTSGSQETNCQMQFNRDHQFTLTGHPSVQMWNARVGLAGSDSGSAGSGSDSGSAGSGSGSGSRSGTAGSGSGSRSGTAGSSGPASGTGMTATAATAATASAVWTDPITDVSTWVTGAWSCIQTFCSRQANAILSFDTTDASRRELTNKALAQSDQNTYRTIRSANRQYLVPIQYGDQIQRLVDSNQISQ